MKYVAFIGSRDLSQFSAEQLTLYKSTVLACVQHGYAIVTGACSGADQIAAETALEAGGKVLLVAPWNGYEREWIKILFDRYGDAQVRTEFYEPKIHQKWTDSVLKLHPQGGRLKDSHVALHARNFGIVGRSTVVVALPNYEKGGGGTAQGLRVAAALGIKAFDLRDPAQCAELEQRLINKPAVAK
jgi:hypothetical protein